jgi:Zn-dependent peptidase ImmA (M78 family)/transcriptional regulator with XRE-family HTH domain
MSNETSYSSPEEAQTNPRILGARIQEARKTRGITQQAAADGLLMSRPTYIAIEKGDRPVQPQELVRLAELYGRSIHELLRQRMPIRDFVSHFRTALGEAPEGHAELDDSVTLLQRLTEQYVELEQLFGSPLPRNYPVPYDVTGLDPVEAAEQVAASERNRLGFGDGPVNNLRDLLETDVGLRIFCIGLPSRVSGLFIFSEDVGGCIAVQRKHPAGRRLWSLCHEYGHFLVHRYEAEVTVLRTDSRSTRKERFADHFARVFLMPERGVKRRFHDLLRSAGQVTPASLLGLSELYGVSFEALLRRCEDLRLLRVGTWQRLKENSFQVKEAQQLLGVAPGADESMLPQRYVNFAVRAFEAGERSEGELMDLLLMDRQRVRRVVEDVLTQNEVTLEGEAGQLTLDLGEALAGKAA